MEKVEEEVGNELEENEEEMEEEVELDEEEEEDVLVTFRMGAEGGDTHSCAGEQEIGSIHDLSGLPRHLRDV